MIYIKCSLCGKKEYYENSKQLFTDLRMVKAGKHNVICMECLNKGMNS
jgi:hypothetical protein